MEPLIEIQNRCRFRLKNLTGYRNRLDEELDWINTYGGAKALLAASNLVRDIKKAGIFKGFGQGPSCCSLVCYGLGITDIDPVVWKLPFATFKKHFKEEPVFYIDTSSGGEELIEKAACYADYPEFVNIGHSVAEIQFIDDKSVDHAIYVIEDWPDLDLLKSFQDNRVTDIKKINLDENILKLIIDDGVKSLRPGSAAVFNDFVKAFDPECFSDLCVIDALSHPHNVSVWAKVLDAKKTGNVPSTGVTDIDRILAESYGQLVYEEQLDSIKELAGCIEPSEYESILRNLEYDEEKLPDKGTVITRIYEEVQIKAYEMKLPGEFVKNYTALAGNRKY